MGKRRGRIEFHEFGAASQSLFQFIICKLTFDSKDNYFQSYIEELGQSSKRLIAVPSGHCLFAGGRMFAIAKLRADLNLHHLLLAKRRER